MAGCAPAGIVAVDARILLLLLLHVDGMDGRSGGDVGEGNLDRVFDRVQELDHHVRHVAERQFASLVAPGPAARSSALAQGAPHLQRVKQERLHVVVVVVVVVVEDGCKKIKKRKAKTRNADGGREKKGQSFFR